MTNEKYPRNDIWERKPYEALIADGSLTTFFRPGDRVTQTNEKIFKNGETLTMRILEKPGCEERGFVPIFDSNHFRHIKVVEIYRKNIEKLTAQDFKGSSPDVQNITQLRYNLGITYNRPIDSKTFNEVTVIKVEYLDNRFQDTTD